MRCIPYIHAYIHDAHTSLYTVCTCLQEGISQQAAEVRVTATNQLVKIVRNAGSAVRPYIQDVAPVLLESLSSLEPQSHTYMQQHAERMDANVAHSLERARLSASRNTPVTETLEVSASTVYELYIIYTHTCM
jgi:hypothetical protein